MILSPLGAALVGMALEKTLISRVYHLDHIYGLLLTYGLMMFIMGAFIWIFATAGRPYPVPAELRGGFDLGFMFLPKYRAWVVLMALIFCFGTWYAIEKTPIGRTLRAATENPSLTRAFGVNVPALLTFGFGVGVALAGFAGVMAAPIYSVSPLMGGDLVIVIFAVVVVGGMGSILGAIVTAFSLGLLEGLAKVVYPQGSNMVIFVIMLIVLLVKPAGLFGTPTMSDAVENKPATAVARPPLSRNFDLALYAIGLVILVAAPFFVYPLFLAKVLCFCLFACAFNLLLGSVGLLSLGHAAFFGSAAYVTGHALKEWGLPFELAALLGHRRRRAARRDVRLRLDPPTRPLLRDDHARARADDLLPRLPAPVHPRGRRPHRRAARQAAWACSISTTISFSTIRRPSSSSPAIC